MVDHTSKVAVVTGGARGIGRAIALELGRHGHQLALIDIGKEQLDQARTELAGQNVSILSLVADVSSEEDIKQAVSQIEKQFGPIDILVNNAGITRDTLCVRMKLEDWQKVIDINLTGAFLLSKQVLRGMMKRHWGRIVNISSVVALTGNAGQVNYAASKAGLIGLTRSLAREVASRCITVNAIAPGFIETEMTDKLHPDMRQNMLHSIPLKRYGSPEDVATTVSFLVSDNAAYITGQIIHVNGGLFM